MSDVTTRDLELVKRLQALPPHEAARWLAKWLITTDVQRGYSEQNIALGGAGYSGSLGDVSVGPGRQVQVRRIGPPVEAYPAWAAYPTGYAHGETFSLHALYDELRAELFAPARPQQVSLWGSETHA